jgi:hypothetical protein
VAEHRAVKPAVATPVSAAVGKPGAAALKQWGARCDSILESAQLGDSLNEQDRAYVKEKCQ